MPRVFTYDSWSHLTDRDSRDGRHTAERRGYSDLSHIGKNLDGTSASLEESQDVNVCVCGCECVLFTAGNIFKEAQFV